jgi:hypothetical protein
LDDEHWRRKGNGGNNKEVHIIYAIQNGNWEEIIIINIIKINLIIFLRTLWIIYFYIMYHILEKEISYILSFSKVKRPDQMPNINFNELF